MAGTEAGSSGDESDSDVDSDADSLDPPLQHQFPSGSGAPGLADPTGASVGSFRRRAWTASVLHDVGKASTSIDSTRDMGQGSSGAGDADAALQAGGGAATRGGDDGPIQHTPDLHPTSISLARAE